MKISMSCRRLKTSNFSSLWIQYTLYQSKTPIYFEIPINGYSKIDLWQVNFTLLFLILIVDLKKNLSHDLFLLLCAFFHHSIIERCKWTRSKVLIWHCQFFSSVFWGSVKLAYFSVQEKKTQKYWFLSIWRFFFSSFIVAMCAACAWFRKEGKEV